MNAKLYWWVGALLLAPLTATADTVHVPADHETIQAALDAASPGDSVMVAPGSYTEIILVPAGVSLIAAEGPAATFLISAGLSEKLRLERLVVIGEGAERSTLIEGFTFLNGGLSGTAIFCENASPTIRGNIIDNPFSFGINIRFGSPRVEDNRIAGAVMIGVAIIGGSPEFVRNTITRCDPRAIEVTGVDSKPVFGGAPGMGNRIYGNASDIVMSTVNDIDATHNDWGWATTAIMDANPWPADIATILDGNDWGKSRRGRGVVDYRHWVRPEAESGSEAAESNRWLLPVLVLAGLALLIVVIVRR